LDLRPYVGRYERVGIDTEISADGDELVVTMTPTGANVELGIPPQTVRFQAVSRDLFVGPQGIPITFLEFDARGRPAYLHTGRAARRVQGTAGKANKAATTATRRATPAKSAAGKKAAAKKAAPRKAAARKTAAGGRKRAR